MEPELAGKPEAFRKAGRQSRCEDGRVLLIWTASVREPPLESNRGCSGVVGIVAGDSA